MSAELVCAATDPAWLEHRREGITATDIVTIAGLVSWDSPWALYHRKLGLLPEVEQSDRMRLGSWLEEAVWDHWFDQQFGLPGTMISGLYRSTARTWQMATPDKILIKFVPDEPTQPKHLISGIGPKGHSDPSAVLECKTSATREGWGPDGSDQVPAHVRAQVLWQMDTLGVGTGHVAVVFLPSREFRSYTISHPIGGGHNRADCAICDEQLEMRDLGFGFWSRILTRRPPDLDGLEVTTDALRYLHPAPHDSVEIDMSRADLELYDKSVAEKREAESYLKTLQNVVRAAMGDAHEATVDGKVVFRRTVGKRAGYTVPPGETDTLRRIGKDKD